MLTPEQVDKLNSL